MGKLILEYPVSMLTTMVGVLAGWAVHWRRDTLPATGSCCNGETVQVRPVVTDFSASPRFPGGEA